MIIHKYIGAGVQKNNTNNIIKNGTNNSFNLSRKQVVPQRNIEYSTGAIKLNNSFTPFYNFSNERYQNKQYKRNNSLIQPNISCKLEVYSPSTYKRVSLAYSKAINCTGGDSLTRIPNCSSKCFYSTSSSVRKTSNTTEWTGYMAPEGFTDQLRTELTRNSVPVIAEYDRLLLTDRHPHSNIAWAENVWYNIQDLSVPSINKAARTLKTIQRNWALLPGGSYRRARLIAEQLPYVSFKNLRFPESPPKAPLGGFTLPTPDRMLVAPHTASPFPHGRPTFLEDRRGPPNRAYLKLWEALTMINRFPGPGERCLDLGASPGGWSWVLADLGAQIMAVDKAPLADHVTALPNVTYRQESAFSLHPEQVGPIDWFFSDVICYPAKLLKLVRKWLDAGTVRNFVCTVKFQGETDFDTMDAFAAIQGSRLVHLHHNKHELTWIYCMPEE